MSKLYYGSDPDLSQKYAQLAVKIAELDAKLEEVTVFAQENKLGFHWDGPTYGMGGYFSPVRDPSEIPPKPEYGSDEYWDWCDQYDDENQGWSSSSNSC